MIGTLRWLCRAQYEKKADEETGWREQASGVNTNGSTSVSEAQLDTAILILKRLRVTTSGRCFFQSLSPLPLPSCVHLFAARPTWPWLTHAHVDKVWTIPAEHGRQAEVGGRCYVL